MSHALNQTTTALSRTSISYLWREPEAAKGFAAGVSAQRIERIL